MDQLPPDVIYRIADRLTIKRLAMFRCARKEWYTDPFLKTRVTRFIETTIVALDVYSRSRGPDREPVFEVDIDRNLVKASIPQLASVMRPRLMGTCNGLMCFLEDKAARNSLVLVEPLLEEVMSVSTLPPPEGHVTKPREGKTEASLVQGWDINLNRGWTASGLGLDHASGEYKLVVFTHEKIRVFNFYTRSWWEIISPVEGIPWGIGVFLGGSLYWQRTELHSHIVSFDVAEEDFSVLLCPISIDTLFDQGNHLGVAAFNQQAGAGYIDIWEFNLHNKGWTNKYKIYSHLLLIERSSALGGYCFDIIGTQNEMILFKVSKMLYSYDPRSRKLECVHPKGPATEFYCLRGSLEESLSQFIMCKDDRDDVYYF